MTFVISALFVTDCVSCLLLQLRLWTNMQTVTQQIVPLRTHVIRYMCGLSDKDLRLAASKNMTAVGVDVGDKFGAAGGQG